MTKYILSFDPGGTTGWAQGIYTDTMPLTFYQGGQIPNGVVGFCEFISHDTPWKMPKEDKNSEGVIIVSESFVLDGRTPNPDVTPLRIEGAMTALLGPDTVIFQRNTKKGLVGDAKLNELGMWIPGQRHQMDARLHALAWAKLNHRPTQLAYWPEIEEEN